MSTDTAETDQTDALPANLVKIPSGELHERAEARSRGRRRAGGRPLGRLQGCGSERAEVA